MFNVTNSYNFIYIGWLYSHNEASLTGHEIFKIVKNFFLVPGRIHSSSALYSYKRGGTVTCQATTEVRYNSIHTQPRS
jgi:hypothetical protein